MKGSQARYPCRYVFSRAQPTWKCGRAVRGTGEAKEISVTIRAPLYCRSFVDREAEMSALLELSARAAGGSGAVVLLSGEPESARVA